MAVGLFDCNPDGFYATHSFVAITPTNCFARFPVFQKSDFSLIVLDPLSRATS
jgi:hypothetical protein